MHLQEPFTLVSRQKDTHRPLFLVKEVRHMPLPMLPKVIPSRQQCWWYGHRLSGEDFLIQPSVSYKCLDLLVATFRAPVIQHWPQQERFCSALMVIVNSQGVLNCYLG